MGEQFLGVRAVERGMVDRVEEAVQQVGGGAPVAVEADDAVGGQIGAVGGDGVEQRGAAGSGLAGEADAPAAGEQADEALALLLALQQRELGCGRPRRDGRCTGALVVGALGGGAADGRLGLCAGRDSLDLAAVDGVDRQQEVTGRQPDHAGLLRCGLAEVGGVGLAGRPATAVGTAGVVGVLPVLFRPLVCRVHQQVPQTRRARFCPSGLARPAVASGPVSATGGCHGADGRTLDLRTVSTHGRGAGPSGTSHSGEDCASSALSARPYSDARRTRPGPDAETARIRPRGRDRVDTAQTSDSPDVRPPGYGSDARQGIGGDPALDRQDAVQPGGHQEPLHLRRDSAQHEPTSGPAGPAVGPHDDAESGGVPGIQLGQVQHQIAGSVVDGRVEDRTGVRRASDVEAAPTTSSAWSP